jgi:hypothetical protein
MSYVHELVESILLKYPYDTKWYIDSMWSLSKSQWNSLYKLEKKSSN